MKTIKFLLFFLFFSFSFLCLADNETLPSCIGDDFRLWTNCRGVVDKENYSYAGDFKNGKFHGRGILEFTGKKFYGDYYQGEFRDGMKDGFGIYFFSDGEKYVGSYKNGMREGFGTYHFKEKNKSITGIWSKNNLIEELENKMKDSEKKNLQDRKQKKKLISKYNSFKKIKSKNFLFEANISKPFKDGSIIINILTEKKIKSLRVNGKSNKLSLNGIYSIKKLPMVDQENEYVIDIESLDGKIYTKSLFITRRSNVSNIKKQFLNPQNIIPVSKKDAVALIIGVQEYENLPKANYASNDAKLFYDYAIRSLGVKSENIKLLVDNVASRNEILIALKRWLPTFINKNKTDIYIFFSGHGIKVSNDNLKFFLPYDANKDLVEDTGIGKSYIISQLADLKSKSVTLFFDTCFSGMTKSGQSIINTTKGINIKSKKNIPKNFTIFSASGINETAISSDDLGHGLFSFYLMSGLEGKADINNDKKITNYELHNYLRKNVSQKAQELNFQQNPEFFGDSIKVLYSQ